MRWQYILIAATALSILGATANATRYHTAGIGACDGWNEHKTWKKWDEDTMTWLCTEPGEFPRTGDKAIIRTGHRVCLKGNEVVGHLMIEPDGEVKTNVYELEIDGTFDTTALNIETGMDDGRLIANSGTIRLSSSDIHQIDGLIRLSGDSSQMIVEKTLTLSGTGRVRGEDNAARIAIRRPKTLTVASGLTIMGHMQIMEMLSFGGGQGSSRATLDNDGTVIANVPSQTLELMSGLRLNGSSGDFKAGVNADAVLKFSQAHTTCGDITSDFFVADCAKLDFNASITTTGDFTCDSEVGGQVTGTLTYGANCDTTATGCGDC